MRFKHVMVGAAAGVGVFGMFFFGCAPEPKVPEGFRERQAAVDEVVHEGSTSTTTTSVAATTSSVASETDALMEWYVGGGDERFEDILFALEFIVDYPDDLLVGCAMLGGAIELGVQHPLPDHVEMASAWSGYLREMGAAADECFDAALYDDEVALVRATDHIRAAGVYSDRILRVAEGLSDANAF